MPAAGDDERGQAMPLLVIVVALVALTLVGIGALAQRLVARQRAQAAADAAALACVVGGAAQARSTAAENGAAVLSVELVEQSDGVVCTVRVAIDQMIAVARATDRVTTDGLGRVEVRTLAGWHADRSPSATRPTIPASQPPRPPTRFSTTQPSTIVLSTTRCSTIRVSIPPFSIPR